MIKLKYLKSIAIIIVIATLVAGISINADNTTVSKTEALAISKAADFTVDGIKVATLGDEQLSTRHKLSDEQTVQVQSDTPIQYVYVLFNRPPQRWTLKYGTQLKPQGTYGFMYELVRLDALQTELSMTFSKGTEICDIYLYGEGELPKNVQQWQPPLEDADILLLPTHSDDEHVFFGGIIPYYASELHKKVQVAYLNNHYGEWYRPHELLAGLWEVGVTAYPIVPDEFADKYSESLEHAKTLYDVDTMLGYEVELLRRFKPEVVIGHDLNGEYGHGVHMLNAHLLTQAVELSGDATKYPESVEKYGTFDVPKTYLHLYEDDPIELDIDRPLASFGGKTAYEVSVDGFAHHKSQQQYFKVNKGGKYDCRKFGLYRSTVGPDMVGISLFENIVAVSNVPVSSDSPSEASSEPSNTTSSDDESSNNGVLGTTSGDTSSYQPTTGANILQGFAPKLLVILGVVVILFTLIGLNKRNSKKIASYKKAYENAPKNR